MKKLLRGVLALIYGIPALIKIFPIVLIVSIASPASAGDPALPKPGAMSAESIFLTRNISVNYDTLLITGFSSDGVEYRNVSDVEKSKIVQMLPELKSNITLTLEAELKAKKVFKNIFKRGTASGKVVILEGSLSE